MRTLWNFAEDMRTPQNTSECRRTSQYLKELYRTDSESMRTPRNVLKRLRTLQNITKHLRTLRILSKQLRIHDITSEWQQTSKYAAEPSETFQNHWESPGMPQITSDNLNTPLEHQKSPVNLQEPFRTARNKWERSWKPPNITEIKECLRTFRNFFEQLKTHKNASERLRIHQNTYWMSKNALETSGIFMTWSKHIGQTMPKKLSGTFQTSS